MKEIGNRKQRIKISTYQGRFFVIQLEAITTKAIFVFRDQKMKIVLAVIVFVQRKNIAEIMYCEIK